jgi:hypothetical protein
MARVWGLTGRLACVCGSRACSCVEGSELGRLPAWLGRFLFPFLFFLALFFYYFPFLSVVNYTCISCELYVY